MPGLVLRPRARQDLIEIWVYIADQSGAERADEYLRRLESVLGNLATHPHMGRRRRDVGDDLRSFPFESHVVFYLPHIDGAEIIRVIHTSRDLHTAWSSEGT